MNYRDPSLLSAKVQRLRDLDQIDITTSRGMEQAIKGYTRAVWPQIAKRYTRVLTEYPWLDAQIGQEISVFVWNGLQRYKAERGGIRYAFVRKAVLFEVFRGVIRTELAGFNQTTKRSFARGGASLAVRLDDDDSHLQLESAHPSPEKIFMQLQETAEGMRQLSFAVSKLNAVQRQDLRLMWEGVTAEQAAKLENKTEQAIGSRRRSLIALLKEQVKEMVPWNYTDMNPYRLLMGLPLPDMRALTRRKGAPSRPITAEADGQVHRYSGFPEARLAGHNTKGVYRSIKSGRVYNGFIWAYDNA